MSDPTRENKEIAKYFRDCIGGVPKVTRISDTLTGMSVDVISSSDKPIDGCTTASTVGLSDYLTDLFVDGKVFGFEILIVYGGEEREGKDILANCAFYILSRKLKLWPGVVIPGVVRQLPYETDMRHVLLTEPYEIKIESREFGAKRVAWLLALPISDEELKYAKLNGEEELRCRLQEESIDDYYLYRDSIF